MTNKLFVAGLSYNLNDSQLGDYFATAGKVLSAKVIMDKYTGQSKGFGFVEMATEEEAKIAMDKLNNTDLDGRNIIVKEAKPQEDRSRSFGGGGSRNNDRNDRGNRW